MLAAVFLWMAARSWPRLVLPVGAIVTVLVAGMMMRGIVLSGYPLYPSTVMAADVDWRVLAAQADIERTLITTHAQWRSVYATTPPPGNWLLDWGRATLVNESERHHAAGGARLWDSLRLSSSSGVATSLRSRRHGWLDALDGDGGGFGGVVFLCAFGTIRVGVLLDRRGGGRGRHRFPRATGRHCDVAAGGAGCCVDARGDESSVPSIGSDWFRLGDRAGGDMVCRADRDVEAQRRPGGDRGAGARVLSGRRPGGNRHLLSTDASARADVLGERRATFPSRAKTLTSARARRDPASPSTKRSTSRYEFPLPTTPHFNRYLELRRPPDFAGGFRNVSPGRTPDSGIGPTSAPPTQTSKGHGSFRPVMGICDP